MEQELLVLPTLRGDRTMRHDRNRGECIGGGWAAAPRTGSIEGEGIKGSTGACWVCKTRFVLDLESGIPRHLLPSYIR
jgi:hypothetical protein